jgi:hypothetical protein
MHALDMDTGAIVWDNGTAAGILNDASYAPTTGVPGLVFTGTILAPMVRIWDSVAGGFVRFVQVATDIVNPSVFSGATVVDGTLIVGQGTGVREDPHDFSYELSQMPRALHAFCVPGTLGCGACQNGTDDDDDGQGDFPEDPGCESADDPSEKRAIYPCDDGLDDDGDGAIDADDPGCPAPNASPEDPQCDNGVDDNGDGAIDWLDPNCQASWPYWEATPPCGLGAELVLLLALFRRHSSSKRAR